MDIITNRFESRIRISHEKLPLLQARIEYLYYFMLGFLWNKQRDSLTNEELIDFVGTLNGKLTIGNIIKTLKRFDKDGDFIDGKQAEQVLVKYKSYRDNNIGHGYVFSDRTRESEEKLEELYDDLLESIPNLKKPMDIIVVQGRDGNGGDDKLTGVIFKVDDKGEPDCWTCSADLIDSVDLDSKVPQVYYRIGLSYFKVSPFVLVDPPDAKCFVFNKIEQKLTGKTVYSKLFETGKESRTVLEFIDTSNTNDYQRISSNRTIMNLFQENYRGKYRGKYVEVGLTEMVKQFLTKNSASVSAVLWGNGGVGKTACAQKVCLDLFNDTGAAFEYIVFVTAKDRRFNERTGQIEVIENGQNYYGIINAIYTTRHGKPLECAEDSPEFQEAVNEICRMTGQRRRRALLLVIDDYETFPDAEKAKISKFVQSLDLVHHKVLITTRNRKLADGYSIQSNALDQKHTIDFLKEKMTEIYRERSNDFERIIRDPDRRDRIYTATGGVPIFMLQWLHLFAQNSSDEELYQKFDSRAEAREFLSGRVYNSLRDDARLLYAALSLVADEDQTFQIERLRYICEKALAQPENFDDAFQELEDLCIVEQYQIAPDNKAQSLYRVYTKSFLDDMTDKFAGLKEATRRGIKGRLTSAGGNQAKYSLFDSLLIEARQSRGRDSESDTVSRYRHILNLPECPHAQKRQALIELIGYYFSYQDSPDKAIETLHTYERDFEREPQVLYKYIYCLWGASNPAYKSVAFGELKKYFEADLSVAADNVQFFALGAAYYTIYTLKVNEDKEKDPELAGSAYEICHALFSYISTASSPEDVKAVSSFRYEIRIALLQAVRLTANLAVHEKKYAAQCVELGKYFLANFQSSVLECNCVQKHLETVTPHMKTGAAVQEPAAEAMPEDCVAFIPKYVKYNIDGLPQYLNGTVNGIKGGIAWYDFDKFGWDLSKKGGTSAVMEQLIERGKAIPVVITSVSDRGMYALSMYNTGLALCDIIQWGDTVKTPKVQDARDDFDPTPRKEGKITHIKRFKQAPQLGEITDGDGVVYRVSKAELAKVADLSEGCRVLFTETQNLNPNAPANTRYACDITKLE